MNKSKYLTLLIFLCCIGVISTILLRQKYEIFFSPFQLITHEDVAKNQQGICVAENRKLSEAELVSRGMVSYLEQFAKSIRPEDTYHAGEPMCSEEDTCTLWKEQAQTIAERLTSFKNNQPIKKSVPYDISLASSIYTASAYQNKEFGFSMFLQNYSLEYFPKDCCNIITKEEFNKLPKKIHSGNMILDDWSKRGWGNFILKTTSLSMGGYILWEEYYALDNCGVKLIHQSTKNIDKDARVIGVNSHRIMAYKTYEYRVKEGIFIKPNSEICFPIPYSEIWEATYIKDGQLFKCVEKTKQQA